MWLIKSGNRKKIGHNGRKYVRVMQCSKVYIKLFFFKSAGHIYKLHSNFFLLTD